MRRVLLKSWPVPAVEVESGRERVLFESLDGFVALIGEQRLEPGLLAVGEQLDAGVQRPPRRIQRITAPVSVTGEALLDAAAAGVQRGPGEADDVEGVHRRRGVGCQPNGSCARRRVTLSRSWPSAPQLRQPWSLSTTSLSS